MAERSASCVASASATWFLGVGRAYYRLTYRTNTKEKRGAQERLRFQPASLQCWGKWARSFT